MTVFICPSKIAAIGGGFTLADGLPATSNGRCALCGVPHSRGDSVTPFAPERNFNDFAALAAPGSRVMCIYCATVWQSDYMRKYSRVVVTEEGVFRASSSDHLAWWFMHPPARPYLFFQSDQQRQHLVWRAPVNLSQDILFIRAGSQILTVRRAVLQRARLACEAFSRPLMTPRARRPVRLPFRSLSPDRTGIRHGQLLPEVAQLALDDAELATHQEVLLGLTPGELWALTVITHAKHPHQPPAMRIAR